VAPKTKRIRDYRKEYQARIARGLASGKSRSAARGHTKASDLTQRNAPLFKDRREPLEQALKLMKQGASQHDAAKAVGVSTERLRRFLAENTEATRQGRRWIIFDRRPVTVLMATVGKIREVTVTHDASSDIGRHWVAINKFLETNDRSHLSPFLDLGLRDVKGRFHPFETRPNVLRKLDSAGELSFIDIYRQTAQQ
jgi:hypothetical protein